MLRSLIAPCLLAVLMVACSSPPSAPATSQQAAPAPTPAAGPAVLAPTQAPRLAITVHKSPTCGCCSGWVDHLRREGFEVKVIDEADLAPIKRSLGVPSQLASCHTAQIQGLFVEGHVPADDIRQMLADKAEGADIRGIAVPGMPAGSPGMEMGGRKDPYQVIEVASDGAQSVFATHPAP